MGKIIVGGVLKKDNKYLLVQEAQENVEVSGIYLQVI